MFTLKLRLLTKNTVRIGSGENHVLRSVFRWEYYSSKIALLGREILTEIWQCFLPLDTRLRGESDELVNCISTWKQAPSRSRKR